MAEPWSASVDGPLDCLVTGGGPAGVTAALYLARFERRFMVVDTEDSRAAWIPKSHNIPVLADGVSGKEILARQREHIASMVRASSGRVRSATGRRPTLTTSVAARATGSCIGPAAHTRNSAALPAATTRSQTAPEPCRNRHGRPARGAQT